MGFRTAVVLMNDLAHEWQHDPFLGRKIAHAAAIASWDPDQARRELPYGRILEQVHGDTISLAVLDGYSGHVVATTQWQRSQTVEDAEWELLQQLAAKHGVRIPKKRKKTVVAPAV